MVSFTGGCLCGAIRYSVEGEPLRILNCHCGDCRRTTGSAFGTFVFVAEGDLTVFQGEPKSYAHDNGAGATMVKQFCPTCGTQLFGRGSRGAGMVHIKIGTIDDAAGLSPEMDIFTAKKLPFVRLSEETAHHAEGRPR